MLAVSGIVVKKGRVLLCRRRTGLGRGTWEFPTFEIEDGETAEDSLERNFFDSFSVRVSGMQGYGARTMDGPPFVRIFLYGAQISGKMDFDGAYDHCKWLSIKGLANFRQSPACVTAIKGLESL